mgnify:CR=1 FL=1
MIVDDDDDSGDCDYCEECYCLLVWMLMLMMYLLLMMYCLLLYLVLLLVFDSWWAIRWPVPDASPSPASTSSSFRSWTAMQRSCSSFVSLSHHCYCCCLLHCYYCHYCYYCCALASSWVMWWTWWNLTEEIWSWVTVSQHELLSVVVVVEE